MIKRIHYWNVWRKRYPNSLTDSLAVLFGLKWSASFEITAIAEEQKEWEKILQEARNAIARLHNACIDISLKMEKGENNND